MNEKYKPQEPLSIQLVYRNLIPLRKILVRAVFDDTISMETTAENSWFVATACLLVKNIRIFNFPIFYIEFLTHC